MSDSDVRTRILHAATRLFGQKGFGGVSVRELVDAAGVTKPTLYYWFENKDAVLVEAVQAHVARMRELVGCKVATEGDVAARIRSWFRAYVDSALQDMDGIRLVLSALHPGDDGQPPIDRLTVHMSQLETLRDLLESACQGGELRADLDLEVASLALLGMANMHVVAALEGVPLPDDLADRLTILFLHGAAPR